MGNERFQIELKNLILREIELNQMGVERFLMTHRGVSKGKELVLIKEMKFGG
ncbi:hypothetical protein JMUB7507_26680 [Staphylococcus aureus]